MKTVGVIAEYNPFHTGHEYHLKKARELSGADFCIVVMSPDFVQRGEPALIDKYTRARMALSCGADLVLELPVCYATGSAEYFAEGAVSLLDRLGVTDTLCFGAEKDNVRLFHLAARILLAEPDEYRQLLQRHLKSGMTFPRARSAALTGYLLTGPVADAALSSELSSFLETPNNILGIEYCKALQKNLSQILPLPVMRTGSDYNSHSLEGAYCSASAIRNSVNTCAERSKITPFIPSGCQDLFEEACRCPLTPEDLLPALKMRLLDLSCAGELADILDISEDLADRIYRHRHACLGVTFEECIKLLKTRQLTETRIRRALLHLILNIHSEETENFRLSGSVFYANVLGLRRDASALLRRIKEESDIPLITKPAHAARLTAPEALAMWNKDVYASHLYRSIRHGRYGVPFHSCYETGPVIL